MRINKYIAQSGVCSRRKADELIQSGKVKVNNAVLKEVGYDVKEGDVVTVNGTKLENFEKHVYYLLNKPLSIVTTMKDEMDRETVFDLVQEIEERIYPVGRLDYNTSGALIMTNDGEFAYRVSHPKHELYKTYVARVSGVLSETKCKALRNGVDIGGYTTKPCKIKVLKGDTHSTIVEISIREGKNHQVRKMFKAIGNPVQELERTKIGDVSLGRLLPGHYRKLTREEIESLKNA